MKKYFVETNGYNCVAIVDKEDNALILHEECFNEPLTLESAKRADYSNLNGDETVEECLASMGGDLPNIELVEDFFTISDEVKITLLSDE